MQMQFRPPRNVVRGFTLVEVVMALAITMMGFAGIMCFLCNNPQGKLNVPILSVKR